MALNKSDLDQIDNRLDKRFEHLDKHLDRRFKENTKEILSQVGYKLKDQKEMILTEIDNKLQNLKSDFFEIIEPILKEVVTAREESPLVENRLEALEEIHPKGKHVLTS